MTDWAGDLARIVMRRVLPIQERKRRRALRSALSTVAIETEKSAARGFDASTSVLNVALFFLIAERDIQAVKIDALTHPDPWRRSVCARFILLTIHEWDMDKVAGQKLKQALRIAGAPEEAKKAAIDALRAVRTVQRKAQKEFAFLRNATIAHRDPDAMAQYNAITTLNEMKVIALASEFYAAADSFVNLMPKLILQTATLPSLLAQYTARVSADGPKE
jgi:hypothetical protein